MLESGNKLKVISTILLVIIIVQSFIIIYQFQSQSCQKSVPFDYVHFNGQFSGWKLNSSYPNEGYLFFRNWDDWNNSFTYNPLSNDSYRFNPDFVNCNYAYAYWFDLPSTGYMINITRCYYNIQDSLIIQVEKIYPMGMAGQMITGTSCFIEIQKTEMNNIQVQFSIPEFPDNR